MNPWKDLPNTADFIDKLSNEARLDNITSGNIYTNKYRLENLKKYLNYYQINKPDYMLVGEAPGYKGCAISGIPFTSTYVIVNSAFFKNFDMNTVGNKLQKEATSTIIWNYFEATSKFPLLWNIYPFHPHKTSNVNSNRTPSHAEILIGKEYMIDLLNIFPGVKVIAIGNMAYNAICEENIPVVAYARHPSFGGKNEFLEQMNRYLKK